ncbi:hypothetical protein GCM10022260_17330 [Gaetbulibacter aestuarii]
MAAISIPTRAQEDKTPKAGSRKVHYMPDGYGFVLKNGSRKFNRALYGTNTGFRIEAGDLPEFALYLPGMGGNFQFGIADKSTSKWITEGDSISTRYNPGEMIYEIRDSLIDNGIIKIHLVAHPEKEAMIAQIETENIPKGISLFWLYGGVNGKKFNRDGDIGADPESVFYLKPEYCVNNKYTIKNNHFVLNFGVENKKQKAQNKNIITGRFPKSLIRQVEINNLSNPLELFQSVAEDHPAILGKIDLNSSQKLFWEIEYGKSESQKNQKNIASEFQEGIKKINHLTQRVLLKTPDSYVNTLGGALAIAGDAIWEYPAYLHGAVAWRMHLNGWRGAYVADPLGWHDRAEAHFKSYGKSQVMEPESGPVVFDTFRNLARQKEVLGTTLYSRGYISSSPNDNTKVNLYDMNPVFINQLLQHYQWTGDLEFIKELWPVVKRHIDWEKRNFDADSDGLYDAYANIWASDALEYSGGGVTYASAYNYSCNLFAASIAQLLNENPDPYLHEAKQIKSAVENNLWISEKGVFSEYKDKLGRQLVHDQPGLWTIYHSIDEGIANSFQAWQSLRYIDTEIPHIPVKAKGLSESNLYLLSTSNWQPYTWSVNNVALAENLNTALAYWEGGRPEEAFKLWQSSLIESMYLGASPGGFEMLSYYDAMRGESYRDFADPIGMAARSLVEGLFGIQPNAIKDTLFIKPGFPSEWNHASLQVPDISLSFQRINEVLTYDIKSNFRDKMGLQFTLDVLNDGIEYVTINDKPVKWQPMTNAIGNPEIIIKSPYQKNYRIDIKFGGNSIETPKNKFKVSANQEFTFRTTQSIIDSVYDPQKAISKLKLTARNFQFKVLAKSGNKTFFVRLKQNTQTWWQPVYLNVKFNKDSLSKFQNWDKVIPETTHFEKVSLDSIFNCKVTDIFNQRYLEPRPKTPTLQLPVQGIGNWCYPFIKPTIDDSGLRNKAGKTNNTILSPQGIPFRTPSDAMKNNVLFVSQWDNFPDQVEIPLSGKASHAYFMMVGTTNPMQSRLVNGQIVINYNDGTKDILNLRNPENWWPIEQDYFVDGLAFTTDDPKPPRVYLKSGVITRQFKDFKPIKGFTQYGVDGGAGTILDMPLDSSKILKSFEVRAVANDVIIGLMSCTLIP